MSASAMWGELNFSYRILDCGIKELYLSKSGRHNHLIRDDKKN